MKLELNNKNKYAHKTKTVITKEEPERLVHRPPTFRYIFTAIIAALVRNQD